MSNFRDVEFVLIVDLEPLAAEPRLDGIVITRYVTRAISNVTKDFLVPFVIKLTELLPTRKWSNATFVTGKCVQMCK